jgi:hypothetical protein
MSLGKARTLGFLGLVLSLALFAAATSAARRAREDDPVAAELARAGHAVVPVEQERRGVQLVEMRNLAGLIRVANRYERLILHASSTGAYLVQDDDVVYRWCAKEERGPVDEPPRVERRDLATRPWAERPWLEDEDAQHGVGGA